MLEQVRRVISDSGIVAFHQAAGSNKNIRQESETLLRETLGGSSDSKARQVLGDVFGVENFVAEFSWPGRRGVAGRRFLVGTHDTILIYRKMPDPAISEQDLALLAQDASAGVALADERGHYRLSALTIDGRDETKRFDWKGCRPGTNHVWKLTAEELDSLDASKRIDWTDKYGFPMLKTYIFAEKGVPVAPVWTDIPPVSPSSREFTSWPSQKPIALLDRIIKLGTNPGDIVLDPLCGSGTTLLAAQASGRKWIGCEISPKGVETSARRLEMGFRLRRGRDFKVGNAADLA